MAHEEFLLSERENASALIVTRGGDVQANHAQNLGSVLRYGNVAVVSTVELEDAITSISIPAVRENPYYEGLKAFNEYNQARGGWLSDFVRDSYGFDPAAADVHLLDQETEENPSRDQKHWMDVLLHASVDKNASAYKIGDRLTRWQYTPFEHSDVRTGLTGDRRHDMASPSGFEAVIKSYRQPLQSRYATAVTGRRLYGSESTQVLFSYPTKAEFTRAIVPEKGVQDEHGDAVRLITQIAVREYTPAIPAHIQLELDKIDGKVNDRLNDKSDDDTMALIEGFEDDPYTLQQGEAAKAPYYNLV